MTSSLLENVKIVCFPKPCQDTAWYLLVIPPKKDFDFLAYIIYEFFFLKFKNPNFLFHGLSFDVLEKGKNRYYQTNHLSGGPNLTPPSHISRIIQYKTLRSVIFVIHIIPYYLYEVILHYKAKKNTLGH